MSEKNEWKLVRVNEAFGDLMYWLERCERKGHLENCSDLVEPWEAFDYEYVAAPENAPSAPGDAQDERYQWMTTVAQMKVLAAELIRAAETMGGDDDESQDVELVLAVAPAGTVQDDDGVRNGKPILTVHLAEYPEEGVYPIDPCDPTGGRVDPPAPAAGDALPNFDIEAAAQKMAECMDYPWAHMPEQGRTHMRKYAQAVIDAALAAQVPQQDNGDA